MEWIKVTDRLPSEDDYDQYGEIAVWHNAISFTPGICIRHKSRSFDEYTTYWAKIDPPKQ